MTNWTKESVEAKLRQNGEFRKLENGEDGVRYVFTADNVDGLDLIFFVGTTDYVECYYRYDYSGMQIPDVSDFVRIAKLIIKGLVNEQYLDKLMGPDCIRVK